MDASSRLSSFTAFAQSKDFALILSMLLMLTQSMHTSHALYDLTTLPSEWMKFAFSILTALFMDFLIVFFVANGAIRESYIFFTFCALMNIYAYHINMPFLQDFPSFFSFVPAIGVPYAVHAVAMQMRDNGVEPTREVLSDAHSKTAVAASKKKLVTDLPGALISSNGR